MVKGYHRYEPAVSFGVISSGVIAYDSSGKHLLAAALEKIGVWHVRQGVCTKTLAPSSNLKKGPSLAVTSIASSSSSSHVNHLSLFPSFFVPVNYSAGDNFEISVVFVIATLLCLIQLLELSIASFVLIVFFAAAVIKNTI